MSTVCPKCGSVYSGEQHRCGTTVHSIVLSQWDEGIAVPSASSARWHQTPLGRVFAGLLLAMGLGYGLLQLCAGVIAAWAQVTEAESLNPAIGWGLLLGLQGIAVLAGAALAAVGSRNGPVYGCAIALLSSVIAVWAIQSGAFVRLAAPYVGSLSGDDTVQNTQLEQMPFGKKLPFFLPAFYLMCGAVAGSMGGRVWRIPTELLVPKFEPMDNEPFQELKTGAGYHAGQAAPPPSPWSGRIAWGRVLAGIAVGAGVALLHNQIIQTIVVFSEGRIKIPGGREEALASRQIFALAIMLGGCVAGATRPNGLKQGLLVGIVAGAAQTGLAMRLGYPSDQMFYIMLSALFLAPLGGWFGTGLMPPAGRPRQVLSEPL